jgi:hypothetical protein
MATQGRNKFHEKKEFIKLCKKNPTFWMLSRNWSSTKSKSRKHVIIAAEIERKAERTCKLKRRE